MKDNEIVSVGPGSQVLQVTEDQKMLLRNTVAKGASEDEFKLFILVANRTGLDPFTKQIHFIKRRVWNAEAQKYDEVGTHQTGIDGYRAIANRTGQLAGISDASFEESEKLPLKATVTVKRIVSNMICEFTATARWSEYVQVKKDGNPTGLWQKMPFLMLGKCAEALALRKAFPNELSGLYTHEEMSQASNEVTTPVIQPVAQPMAPKTTLAKKIEAEFSGESAEESKEESKGKEKILCDVAGCGGEMKLKNGARGQFYGCSNYPSCKNTRSV